MLRRCVRAMAPPALANPGLFMETAHIAGKPVPGGQARVQVVDPRTASALGSVPDLGKEGAEQAIAAAQAQFVAPDGWTAQTPKARRLALQRWATLLREHEADLTKILSAESGKPLAEANGEVQYATSYIDFYAGECERIYGDVVDQSRPGVRTLVRKSPVGIVGCITPWNFPAAMITRAAGGALAAGCPVVVKPSEITPFSAIALAELATQAGIPHGAFSVVTGMPAPIGDALNASPLVRKMTFTGSTRVGKMLYRDATATMKRVVMELGGNAPFIVFEDADLDKAADGVMAAKFRNAGQTCICANRVFVHASVKQPFEDKVKERLAKMNVGNAGGEGQQMGCIITKAQAQRINGLVDDAVSRGATVAYRHDRMPTGQAEKQAGTWVPPTMLAGTNETMLLAQDEIFGPILAVQTFEDDADVLKRANAVPVGLAAYFFTENYRRQWRISEGLQFGMVGVNEGLISTPYAPFGGVKDSGIGRDGGRVGIEHFIDYKYTCFGGGI